MEQTNKQDYKVNPLGKVDEPKVPLTTEEPDVKHEEEKLVAKAEEPAVKHEEEKPTAEKPKLIKSEVKRDGTPHSINGFSNMVPVVNSLPSGSIPLPSMTMSAARQLALYSDQLMDDTFQVDEQDATAVSTAYLADARLSPMHNLYEGKTKVQPPISNGKVLGFRQVKSNATGKELYGNAAIIAFSQPISNSGVFSIPLYNTGITISLKDITDNEITALHRKLASHYNELGYKTENLINSNFSMKGHELIYDFVISKLYTCSLDIEPEKLADYILLSDIDSIMVLLLKYITRGPYKVVSVCKNSVIEDNKLKCNHIDHGEYDPLKLQHLIKELPANAKGILAKTRPASQTVEEVLEYQKELSSNDEATYELNDGSNIIYTMKTPTLSRAFEANELWMESLEKASDASMLDHNTADDREYLLEDAARASVLNGYLHYISAATNSVTENYTNDLSAIMASLESCSRDNDLTKRVLKQITKYMDTHTISIVGVEAYICPECGVDNAGSDYSNEIIPLDTFSMGFVHLVNTAKKIEKRKAENLM